MNIACVYHFDDIAGKWIVEVNPIEYEQEFFYSVSSGDSLTSAMQQLKNTLQQVFGLNVTLSLQSSYTFGYTYE